ncbi:MAG: hypothetical protein AB7V46_00155 [Thermomicrobiales bacterium]
MGMTFIYLFKYLGFLGVAMACVIAAVVQDSDENRGVLLTLAAAFGVLWIGAIYLLDETAVTY